MSCLKSKFWYPFPYRLDLENIWREDELGGPVGHWVFFLILGSLSWLSLGVAPIVNLWSLSEQEIRPLSVPTPLGLRYGQSVEREAPLQALCLLDVAPKNLGTLGVGT